MTTIRPTGSCFDDALDFLSERVKRDPCLWDDSTLRLMHGIAVAGSQSDGSLAEGQRYAHAWVEEELVPGQVVAWDCGLLNGGRIYFSVARDEFYAGRQIQHVTAYTPRGAYDENRRTAHFGPWVLEYVLLCKRRTTTPERLEV